MSENPADAIFRFLSPEQQKDPDILARLDEMRRYCDEEVAMDNRDTEGMMNALERSGIKPDTLVMSRGAAEVMTFDDMTRKVFRIGEYRMIDEYRDLDVRVLPPMNRKQRRSFGKGG